MPRDVDTWFTRNVTIPFYSTFYICTFSSSCILSKVWIFKKKFFSNWISNHRLIVSYEPQNEALSLETYEVSYTSTPPMYACIFYFFKWYRIILPVDEYRECEKEEYGNVILKETRVDILDYWISMILIHVSSIMNLYPEIKFTSEMDQTKYFVF